MVLREIQVLFSTGWRVSKTKRKGGGRNARLITPFLCQEKNVFIEDPKEIYYF